MKVSSVRSGSPVDRAGSATRVLVGLSAVLIFLMGVLFVDMTVRQNEMKDGIREDALWAVYQLDREARGLEFELRSLVQSRADIVGKEAARRTTMRYDILYSRMTVMERTKYASFLEESEDFQRRRRQVRDIVLGIETVFNTVAERKSATAAEVRRMHVAISQLLPITERLLTFMNSAVSAARADTRQELMRLQGTSAVVALFLGLALVLLILNLMRQLKGVRAASRQIEEGAAKLTEALHAAEAGNRAKSEFMATIGHEIRTPLNAVLGMAELLSHAKLGQEEREQVRVILTSGTALLEIINEILDYAKIEHGSLEYETMPFSPAHLVRDCVDVMEGRAREQRNRILVQLDLLPAEANYLSDPTRLRRVILNLLSNAVKFTSDGIVRVRASESEDGTRLRFEVIDTGIGIAAEARDRLFNPFSQVDGTISRRFGGTGLGLVICKRIVEGLGGRRGVESAPGVGSCFWFEVPLQRHDGPRLAATTAGTVSTPLPALNVLVVEDNPVNRDLAGRFLARLGQRATFAEDGLVGVAKAADETFDLILMDLQMPGMDGIAATRTIRAAETDRRVPIVAMTASASDSDRELCMAAGMDGFEPKPLGLQRLEAVIRQYGGLAPAGAARSDALSDPASGGMDPARRLELIEAVGAEGLRHLTESFADDAMVILSGLYAAMAASDGEAVDRALHNLKGSAANLGFDRIADLAEANRRRPPAEVEIDRIAAALKALGDDRNLAA